MVADVREGPDIGPSPSASSEIFMEKRSTLRRMYSDMPLEPTELDPFEFEVYCMLRAWRVKRKTELDIEPCVAISSKGLSPRLYPMGSVLLKSLYPTVIGGTQPKCLCYGLNTRMWHEVGHIRVMWWPGGRACPAVFTLCG